MVIEIGIASIWQTKHGEVTAWKKHPYALPSEYVAAHRHLPLGTFVKVTHKDKTVTVQIVDRGPFVIGRIIDLMKAPANEIGITDEMGLGQVTVEIVE